MLCCETLFTEKILKMKKIAVSVLMVSTLLATIPTSVMAGEKNDKTVTTLSETEKVEQSNALQIRLNAINTMDKSNLTLSEKKELRNEVKAIKKASNGGVYISVGGLLIIILLLVILL